MGVPGEQGLRLGAPDTPVSTYSIVVHQPESVDRWPPARIPVTPDVVEGLGFVTLYRVVFSLGHAHRVVMHDDAGDLVQGPRPPVTALRVARQLFDDVGYVWHDNSFQKF